jgi:DNA-binding LytR/AlgR family response regulator
MSGLNFIDSMDEVGESNCRIVIYSSHDKYMLSAFRKRAFDYLLKPIDHSSLETIMQRYYSVVNEEKAKPQSDADRADIRRSNNNFMLYINSSDFVLARAEDIGLFCYNRERKTWEVIISGKAEHVILKHSVTSYMILSLSPKFIQVHQSYIINLDYLIEVVDNTCRFYPPFDCVDYVTVGRVFRKKLTDSFLSL